MGPWTRQRPRAGVEIINAFGPHPRRLHLRRAAGLILSALSVLIFFVTAWNGVEMVYRHGVGMDLRGEARR